MLDELNKLLLFLLLDLLGRLGKDVHEALEARFVNVEGL